MAEIEELGENWLEVQYAPAVHPGSSREKPAVIVEKSGRTVCNSAGTELADEVAKERGLEKEKYLTKFFVDPNGKTVAVVPVPSGTPMAMPTRRQKDSSRTLVMYLQGVLEAHPHIKGPGRRLCMMVKDVDKQGKPFIKISLGAAVTPGQRRERSTAAAPATTPLEE